jgi:hypothetical protein
MIHGRDGIFTPNNTWQWTAAYELPDRPKMREVAAWLGFSYARVRQLAIEGAIPCKKIKRKNYNAYLFDKAALIEWARPEGA